MGKQYDTIFKNATIYDGSGIPAINADVAVAGDVIIDIGTVTSSALHEIDCTDLVLAPGFVDVHTHDDWAVLDRPDMGFKTLQGVTTVIVGNCGTSAIAPGSAFATTESYLSALERSPSATNVATFVGHGSLRMATLGDDQDRAPDDSEMAQMIRYMRDAMEMGAIGLSSGLVYHPGRHAHTDEIVELARVVSEYEGLYSTHMRDEGLGLLNSVRESIEVGARSGARVQISHLKAYGSGSWGSTAEAIDIIRDSHSHGVQVMVDQYPYTRGSTLLIQIISGGGYTGAPTPYGLLTGEQTLISNAPEHPEWDGRTIADIATEMNLSHRDTAELVCRFTGDACVVVTDTLSEDDVRRVMAQDFTMIGSDGIPVGEMPHPRLHHTFPRVIGHYARDLGLIPVEEAIRRMTSLSCDYFGLSNRGRIKVGHHADLTMFDASTVIDTGTYQNPTSVPSGIVGTWINGTRVTNLGRITGARPGRPLRN